MSLLTSIPLAAWLAVLAQLALKATLVLLITAAAAALLWRASAAVRHMVWCVGVVCVLALPVFSVLIPAWEVPVLPAEAAPATPAAPASAALPAPSPVASPVRPATPAVVAETASPVTAAEWAARIAAALAVGGVLVGLLWLAVGFWGANRIGRRAELVRDPEWLRASQDAAEHLGLRRPVLLLRSRGADMPATWGLLWPSVIVPSMADGWPEDRRRAVLAHELAHVKRFDCLTQALAQTACVLFWWHPAVWYAARQLRIERERACDDLVLRGGARASEYAAHLLEVARAHKAMRLAGPAMVSMARPSHLESRLLWVLDGARARGVPSAAATLATVVAGMMIVAPLSAMRPTAAAGAAAEAVVAVDDKQAPAISVALAEVPAVAEKDRDTGARGKPMAIEPGAITALAGTPVPIQTDTPPARRGGERVVERLVEMRAVGVTPEYVAEMLGAGLGELDADDLIGMRANGVNLAYVQNLRRLGFNNLVADEVIGLKALGVSEAYIQEIRAAGYADVTADHITEMRAVGVSAAYIRELAQAGVVPRSARELVELKAVGVTPAYVAQMRAANVVRTGSASEFSELRALGVNAEYVRELESVGLTGLSARTLTELKAHNVTADYVRRMRASGFDAASADEVVRLRVGRVEPKP